MLEPPTRSQDERDQGALLDVLQHPLELETPSEASAADVLAGLNGVVQRTAELSPCGRYRYTLGRHWGPGPKGLVLMVNPSTANATHDDPTIRRLIAWHRHWGLDGFDVVNLLPIRTPDPRRAYRWMLEACVFPGPDQQALHDNMDAIKRLSGGAAQVLVAYGRVRADLQLLADMTLAEITDRTTAPLVCLGLTQAGFPTHPMARGKHRVPDTALPVPFTRGD